MKRTRIIKYIIILFIIVLFVQFIIFLLSPHNSRQFFIKYLERISYYEDEMVVSIGVEDIQKVGGSIYYLKNVDELWCRRDGHDEKVLKNVDKFLIFKDKIYYCHMKGNERGIYCRKLDGQKEEKFLEEEITAFAMNSNMTVVATTDNCICVYDEKWKKKKEIKTRKKKGKIYLFDPIYEDGHIIFRTHEGDVYLYAIEENKIRKLELPISRDKNIIYDMIKVRNKVYYMTSIHEYTDLYSRNSRIDCKENGIYQIDVRNGRFDKVSDECGFDLLCMDDKLYVCDQTLFRGFLKEVTLTE